LNFPAQRGVERQDALQRVPDRVETLDHHTGPGHKGGLGLVQPEQCFEVALIQVLRDLLDYVLRARCPRLT
jgi:hypothetical protein